MSLMSNFKSVQSQLEDSLEASQHLKDDSFAQVLDDILLRQKFWAEDVDFENDPYGSISKEPSDASQTMRDLKAMEPLLADIKMVLQTSPKDTNKLDGKARDLQLANDRLCNSEEIFGILENLEALDTRFNRREKGPKTTFMSSAPPVSEAASQSPISIKDLAPRERNLSFEASTAIAREPPSKLDPARQIEITSSSKVHIPSLVESLSSWTKLVLNVEATSEEIPDDLRSRFVKEQERLSLLSNSMIKHAEANESMKEVNYWKPFEYNLQSVISDLQEFKNRQIETEETLSGLRQAAFESAQEDLLFMIRNARLDTLGGILDSLRGGNDYLDTLNLALSSRDSFKTLRVISLVRSSEEVTRAQKAAVLLGYEDTSHITQAVKILRDTYETAPPLHSAQRFKGSLLIEETKINLPALVSLELKTTFIAEYDGDHVIVDYNDYNDYGVSGWKMPASLLRDRTESLARFFDFHPQLTKLSVLRCLGYVEIEPGVIGIVFRLPQGISPGGRLVTLQDLLAQDYSRDVLAKPDIGERFDLAKALVNTLFSLHAVGRVHHNLSARNILFWPREDDPSQYEYRKPYLVGFRTARSGSLEESLRKEPLESDDHYQYWDHQRADGRQPISDVYRLGMLLLEIGLWGSIQTVSERYTPANRSPRHIIDDAAKYLKRRMGSRYVEAVLACLNENLDNPWSGIEDSMSGHVDKRQKREDHLKYFGSKIVDVIALCNA